jgi:exosortase B
MTSAASTTFKGPPSAKPKQAWWPIILGLIALYAPSYYRVATTLWTTEDQAHGPLVLMVIIYLFWLQRDKIQPSTTDKTSPILGGLFFGLGLLSYIIGRSQDIIMLDLGSQIFLFIGILLLVRGASAVKSVWFPLFFIIFMIPLPSFIVDTVTQPMKIAVSYAAEQVLYWLDYPIARTGVILQIGEYQLLVADACAGMHTLISLEALGLLYLNLVKHPSAFRNITIAALIIPISFTANVTRVITLTLITYYLGDEAGQGFIHKFSGLLLFTVALLLIMGVDSAAQYLGQRWQGKRPS